jgi:surface antigen
MAASFRLSRYMRLRYHFLFLVALGFAAITLECVAQEISPEATFSDRRIINRALQEVLEFTPSNSPREWRNPETNNYGSITVFPAEAVAGTTCRRYEFTWNISGRTAKYVGRPCRDETRGIWDLRTANETQLVQAIPAPVAPAPKPPAKAPPAGSSEPTADSGLIRTIQRNLARLAYYAGPDDGLLNTATNHAIEEFEGDEGLNSTGKPSREIVERSQAALKRVTVVVKCPVEVNKASSTVVCGSVGRGAATR